MFITTFAQNYSQNAGNAISKTQKFLRGCPQTHKEMPGFRLK
jgi:hypothetical protein